MPQYAGNLYNQSNASEVAINTQKAQPSSLFGTRKLKFFSFSIFYNLYTNNHYFNDVTLAVTGGTADGKQVTYTFAEQSVTPYAPGDTIFVNNMTHQKYDGEFTVVASTTSSVTVDWYQTGDTVTGGHIVRAGFNNADSFYSAIVRAIQKVAEIYYLDAPTYKDAQFYDGDFGSFVFAISDELTTSDYDEQGYDYPEEGHDVGEYSKPTDLASAIHDFLNQVGGWGGNGDGWSLSQLDDLGWGFAPGRLAGDPGWAIVSPNN